MPWIAVDKDFGLLYEGSLGYGRPVLPTPSTAPAALVSEGDFSPKLPPSYGLDQAEILFREDSFEAVTRTRRGRLYLASQTRPAPWQVPHPSGVNERRSVYPFQGLHVPQRLKEIVDRGDRPLLAIGTDVSFTIWAIALVEGTSTGEFLLTLRGRQTFGALPELDRSAIPSACQRAVVDAVAKLGDEIFRAGPGSVVDRARDVASAALSGYLQHLRVIGPGRELDELIKKLSGLGDPQKKRVAAAAAEIVRVFHSREKPSVQERLPVRAVREQEAELAVYCVGSLLCELGWAEWS
jgi:hypothetical protein